MAGKEKENPLNCGIKKLKGNGKDVARVGLASAKLHLKLRRVQRNGK